MPNWVTNTIAVRGKKNDVLKFINTNAKVALSELTDDSLSDFIKNNEPSLRTWLPKAYPFNEEDFALDLTNTKLNKDMFLISEYNKGPREYYKSYEEYSKAYDELKKKQLDAMGVSGWYAYNCATLGTKWDSFFEEILLIKDSEDECVITMKCDTAYSAPHAWVASVRSIYTDVRFVICCTKESQEFGGYEDYDGESHYVSSDYYENRLKSINRDDYESEDDYWEAYNEYIFQIDDELFGEFSKMIIE